MKSKSGIYILKNITKQKYYVGESVNISQRREAHFAALQTGKHQNKELQKDYDSGDQFIFIKVWNCPDNRNLLMTEESRLVGKLLDNGKRLYNKRPEKYYLMYMTRENLKDMIVDDYCRHCFGKTFLELTSGKNPARYEVLFQRIFYPDQDQEKLIASYNQVADYYSELRRKGINYET